jgi:hypothetical protein
MDDIKTRRLWYAAGLTMGLWMLKSTFVRPQDQRKSAQAPSSGETYIVVAASD